MSKHSSDDYEAKGPPAGDSYGEKHGDIKTGSLEYVAEEADNGGGTSWQEASGAPVESHSPLGLSVGWITIIFLNINQMIGTGVFSTRTFLRFVMPATMIYHPVFQHLPFSLAPGLLDSA